jgi:hypothetical protein
MPETKEKLKAKAENSIIKLVCRGSGRRWVLQVSGW